MTAQSKFEGSVVPVLSKDHVLTNSKASGRYRAVLVGVIASEKYLTSKFVWYNGVLMHSAIEVNATEAVSSSAGIFYLLDDELPALAGTYPVKVQFSSNPDNGSGAFTAIEFQNVQQTGPFVTTSSSPLTTDCSSQASRGVALNFNQAGSFGYAVIAARGASSAMATPGTLVETMNLLQSQPAPVMGLAGYAGPINGNTTLSWNVTNCANTAGVGVVLKRVGD